MQYRVIIKLTVNKKGFSFFSKVLMKTVETKILEFLLITLLSNLQNADKTGRVHAND